MEAIVDAEENPVTDSNGRPLVKTSNPRVKLFVYVLDGLIRHALPITDDGGVCLQRFCTFCAVVGEFELAAILHVL